MRGEREPSLVKPPSSAPPGEDVAKEPLDLPEGEPPVTEEELREAEALRRALERGDDPTALALRAALEPSPLESGDLDAILARAMGDLDAPPTAIEQGEAERLRVTLEEHDAQRAGRLATVPGARPALPPESSGAVAVALRAAWAPAPISAARSDALVRRATDAGARATRGGAAPAAKEGGSKEEPAPVSLRRFRMGPRTFAAMTAVVAMAAGVLLFVGKLGQRDRAPDAPVAAAPAPSAAPATERAPRIAARSTSHLFDAETPFPRTGGESARVDRIASARAGDLRANRFAAWGLR